MRFDITRIRDDELLDAFERASTSYKQTVAAAGRYPDDIHLVDLAADAYRIAARISTEVARRIQSEAQEFVDRLT